MMTFEQQDKVLRDYAKRYRLRVIKRPRMNTWTLYKTDGIIARKKLALWFVVNGEYNELLKFFEGIEYGRRNP